MFHHKFKVTWRTLDALIVLNCYPEIMEQGVDSLLTMALINMFDLSTGCTLTHVQLLNMEYLPN